MTLDSGDDDQGITPVQIAGASVGATIETPWLTA